MMRPARRRTMKLQRQRARRFSFGVAFMGKKLKT
jgi:hypothetical protein